MEAAIESRALLIVEKSVWGLCKNAKWSVQWWSIGQERAVYNIEKAS